MKTIEEVEIGEKVTSKKYGTGMVTRKTKRTITVTFENGMVVMNKYRHSNHLFHEGSFN